jgi:hypothetical protein
MWSAVGRRPGPGSAGAGNAVAVQHCAHGQAGEAEADVGQEGPAVDTAAAGAGGPQSSCHPSSLPDVSVRRFIPTSGSKA